MTLYISDLDGTLMQPDATLSDETVRLLNASIADGKLFSVATARTPATVSNILARVNMQLPAIVFTGVALWNKNSGHYSHVKYFDPEALKRLVETYQSTGTSSFLFTLKDDMIDIYHLCGKLLPLQREYYEERRESPYKRFHLDPDGCDTLPPDPEKSVIFYSMLPDAKAASTFEMIKDIPGVKAQYYHDIYGPEVGILEAFPANATKAEGVKMLAHHVGADRIVCFGDNINDLPMMAVADVAVAVENALPEVKAAANIVIGPNTADSVARFIFEDNR